MSFIFAIILSITISTTTAEHSLSNIIKRIWVAEIVKIVLLTT